MILTTLVVEYYTETEPQVAQRASRVSQIAVTKQQEFVSLTLMQLCNAYSGPCFKGHCLSGVMIKRI